MSNFNQRFSEIFARREVAEKNPRIFQSRNSMREKNVLK